MASAGRILIMPKGEWNAETTYEMLDLVCHNGKSWLAKKDVVGIEPSEANEEYWHDLLSLTDVEINGIFSAHKDTGDAIFAKRKLEGVQYEQGVGGVSGLTIGGKKSANFTFKKEGTSKAQFLYNENGAGFVDKSTDTSNTKVELFYGTHNKPYGTYVGNGSDSERVISGKGVGSFIMIWCNQGMGFVSPAGGFFLTGTGEIRYLDSRLCHYSNGILTLRTNSIFANGEEITYTYQCL